MMTKENCDFETWHDYLQEIAAQNDGSADDADAWREEYDKGKTPEEAWRDEWG